MPPAHKNNRLQLIQGGLQGIEISPLLIPIDHSIIEHFGQKRCINPFPGLRVAHLTQAKNEESNYKTNHDCKISCRVQLNTADALRKLEEVFNLTIQRPSNFQRQNRRGHIYAILDGIDAFAGHLGHDG